MIDLSGKNILITGSVRRIGRELALSVARAGGNVILHHSQSDQDAEITRAEIESFGVKCHVIKCDLSNPANAAELINMSVQFGSLFALINNAAIFKRLSWLETNLSEWNAHINLNLTTPFILIQNFAGSLPINEKGRIINILDWRASKTDIDHIPYVISKSGLANLTHLMAVALAPNITVNGIALGAILPPADRQASHDIFDDFPIKRWGKIEELHETLEFLLCGPEYITGEIIHLDGGRHNI